MKSCITFLLLLAVPLSLSCADDIQVLQENSEELRFLLSWQTKPSVPHGWKIIHTLSADTDSDGRKETLFLCRDDANLVLFLSDSRDGKSWHLQIIESVSLKEYVRYLLQQTGQTGKKAGMTLVDSLVVTLKKHDAAPYFGFSLKGTTLTLLYHWNPARMRYESIQRKVSP